MKDIINKLVKEECKIFGFKSSNLNVQFKTVGNMDFIAVHFDISTSKIFHRYILVCLKGNQIIYKTSNCIDKDYFYSPESCFTITKNYFKGMSSKLNKLTF